MGKIFGTDGIRGKANVYPMTPEMALRVGKAVALYFKGKNNREKHSIVIGKDTRLSGYMLETALTSGIVSIGVDVFLVGPMPTPAISHLTKSLNCDAGIVISASHNPSEDNGIKIFNTEGHKLAEEAELAIERMLLSRELSPAAPSQGIGKAHRVNDARGRYIEFAKNSIENTRLNGLKVVIDCANGAAYHIAPQVFSELGAETIVLNNKPDGLNINSNCGALHPEVIQKSVRKEKAGLGIAFDGDADRLIVCDEKGRIVDGDALIAIFAKHLLEKGLLPSKTVIVTVMSNLGLHKALEELGLKVIVTGVGDKHIVDEMKKHNCELGGEQSGHIIFSRHSATGDGIVSALQLARIMTETGKKLSELPPFLQRFPQELISIRVKEKKPLEKMPRVRREIEKAKKELGENGRVLVRYSGTENKARVMVEGKNKGTVKKLAESIAIAVREETGA